ncbi:MAG: L-lysine 6-monooxygenase [Pseudonocardiaceae bacterium]|nr:MAG: L-lysine 6-monooxygenase [Pseudonocardiaceae bacterium]
MFRCGSFDVVGVGFGPSNLALAVAVAEHNTTTPGERLSARFVERQSTFGWHRGMLLEDATMQISFLKDLATLRNPVSPYGFLSYLHDRGRLIDFINYGSAFPTRLEFHDYLEWVAGRFVDDVDYRTTVTSIDPVPDASEFLDIRTSDGTTMRTRNVVVATGLAANLPDGVVPGERIWHTRDLLTRTDRPVDPRRVIVVGAGQSAAEAVDHFHRRFESAEVWAVFNRYGYSPADDTPFANRVFDPGAVDDFFGAPPEVKQMILGYHANTNYSVVDPELIESLYRRHYHEKISGRERLRFLNVSRIGDVVASRDHVELVLESMLDGGREAVRADLVVYATGYRPSDPCDLLGDLTGSCLRDDAGRLSINRDYRVATDPALRAGIYVQGATEHTHGLSSTLLSNIAVRSGEIVQSIAERSSALV